MYKGEMKSPTSGKPSVCPVALCELFTQKMFAGGALLEWAKRDISTILNVPRTA